MPDPVDEIMEAVGSRDDRLKEKIRGELDRLIELGVPPEQAKDTLVNKYSRAVEKKIEELSDGERRVSLVARVISLNQREVTARGEKKTVYSGFLEDETGQCSYSIWQEPNFKVGDAVRINNAYITMWNETKRVNIRSTNDVSPSEKPVEIKREAREIKVKDTESYRGRAKLTCVILSLRSFENSGITVFRGTAGDETGCALISLWKDFGIKEKDVVEIDGATVSQQHSISVSENAEVKKVQSRIKVNPLKVSQVQLNFRNVPVVGKVYGMTKGKTARGMITDGKKTLPFVSWKSTAFDSGDVILAKECNARRYMSTMQIDINGEVEKIEDPELEAVSVEEEVKRISEAEGMATVEGFMIDLKEGGLIRRCPQCNRVLTDMQCSLHGKITEPKIDLRIKAVMDDGSDSATVILNRTLSEKLLGKTLEEYIELVQKALNPDVVLEDCEKILFKPYRARGIFREDSVGKTIIVTAIEPVDRDIAAEAERVLEGYQ